MFQLFYYLCDESTSIDTVCEILLLQINPLVASVALSILLWLTPDDFTRQWETSWQIKGWMAKQN